jgi:hypothetical protein
MLRAQVAALLKADGVMLAALPGGIFPTDDTQPSYMAREAYPAAFDTNKQIRPCLLVQDEGTFPFGGGETTVSATFRLLVWQQSGRDAIEGALRRAYGLLNGARVNAGADWVYRFEFAGDGPNVRDQGLRDAEHGWSRWQAIMVRQ